MKKRKKLALHKETLKEIQQREKVAAGTGDGTTTPISYPTELYSSCPPCDGV